MRNGAAVEYLEQLRQAAIKLSAGNAKAFTHHVQTNIGKSQDLLEISDGLNAAFSNLLGAGNALAWELAPISQPTAELRRDKIADQRQAFETALNATIEGVTKAKHRT